MRLNRRTLRALARKAGSLKSLADSVGLHPSTLYRWIKRGVPTKGRGVNTFNKFFIIYKKEESQDISPDFADLLHLGDKHNTENARAPLGKREPFKLPSKRSKIIPNREGRKTVAHLNTKVWNEKLTQSSLLKVIWWFENETKAIRKPRPVWQLGFTASSFSPFGSANIYEGRTGPVMWIHQLPHPQSDSFVIMYTVASNRYSRKEAAVADISRRIQEELNTLPPKEVFIRTTFINNWRYRSEAEIREYETRRRYERKNNPKKIRKNKV